MGHEGRQEKTVDIAGYHAKGAAQVDAYWTEGCGKEVLERDAAIIRGERYAVDVKPNGWVFVTDTQDGDAHVASFQGAEALMDGVSRAGRLNRGEIPGPSRIGEGDIVVIHKGERRWEVIRVELDSMRSGERLDFALLEAVDGPERVVWQACDILHVVESRTGRTGSLKVMLDEEVREIRL